MRKCCGFIMLLWLTVYAAAGLVPLSAYASGESQLAALIAYFESQGLNVTKTEEARKYTVLSNSHGSSGDADTKGPQQASRRKDITGTYNAAEVFLLEGVRVKASVFEDSDAAIAFAAKQQRALEWFKNHTRPQAKPYVPMVVLQNGPYVLELFYFTMRPGATGLERHPVAIKDETIASIESSFARFSPA